MIISHVCTFVGEISSSIYPIFSGKCNFLLLNIESSLYTVDTSLSDRRIANIFFQSVACFCTLLTEFSRAVPSSDGVQLFFSYVDHAFDIIPKKSLTKSQKFSYACFQNFHSFSFRSKIHFILTFVYGVRYEPIFTFYIETFD